MIKRHYFAMLMFLIIVSSTITTNGESTTMGASGFGQVQRPSSRINPVTAIWSTQAVTTTTSNNVKLKLVMKCGCADHNAAALSDVRVIGQDGAGTSFDTTTDENGRAIIYGEPGTWQFTASKDGYVTRNWTVTEPDTKYPYLLNDSYRINPVAAIGSGADVHKPSVYSIICHGLIAGPIMSNCSINDSRLADKIFIWNIATPWDVDMTNGTEHCRYIRPDDPVVQAVAKSVFLKPGNGLYYYSNRSLRLEIDSGNDTDRWGEHEYYQPPGYTLFVGRGDCDDRAIAICSLLRALKYPAMVIRGYSGGLTKKAGHVWVEYKVDGIVYIADFDQDSTQAPDYFGYTPDHMFNDSLDWSSYNPNW